MSGVFCREDESTVHFVDVDETNWRTRLAVKKEQETYVANATVLLARAYAYRKLNSRAFYIMDGDVPVGMGLYYDCPELQSYILSQLFIDARYQRKGFGKAAVAMCLDEMRRAARFDKVTLCYVEGDEAALNLYTQFGFHEVDREEDEIDMELTL